MAGAVCLVSPCRCMVHQIVTYEKWSGIGPPTAACSLNTKDLMGITYQEFIGTVGTTWFVTYQ
jgi:hypothetical protein